MKSKNKKNIVVIGGGLSGMMTAYLLKRKFSKSKIILIEKSNSLGGLYTSLNFNKKYIFDIGMHVIYKCKNSNLNKILKKIVYNNWQILKYPKKDIAGVYYDNYLNTKSPYIDLTNHGKNKLELYEKELEKNSIKKIKKLSHYKNLGQYFKSRFGSKIFKKIINPIIEKLWGMKSSKMHPFAAILPMIDRIILYKDEINLKRILKNDNLRSRIAYPDQLKLPKKYYSKQSFGLYPKEFGFKNVINFFEKKLIKLKIEILKGAELRNFVLKKRNIESINLIKDKKYYNINNIKKIFWSSPLLSLKNLLNLKIKSLSLDTRKQALVYFLLKNKPEMGNLYYFYCFQKNFNAFRVTNYFNYCKNAKKINGYYPLCVELHLKNNQKTKNFKKLATKELLKMKIIKRKSNIFKSFSVSSKAFPLLSINNVNILNHFRSLIIKKKIKNLILCNLAPEKSIFFMDNVFDQNFNLVRKKYNNEQKRWEKEKIFSR